MNINEYMKLKYLTIIIQEECTDGTLCYRAEHPQLPGCMSHGLTPDEAIRNLIDAKHLYIETLLDKGLDVPMPPQSTIKTSSSAPSSVICVTMEGIKDSIPFEFDMSQAASKAA
jgi:predicted RNase H-like HicB family nuclease